MCQIDSVSVVRKRNVKRQCMLFFLLVTSEKQNTCNKKLGIFRNLLKFNIKKQY